MPKKTYVCSREGCDNTTDRYPSSVRDENVVFCSKDCHYANLASKVIGSGNPNWKGISEQAGKIAKQHAETMARIQEQLAPAIALSRSFSDAASRLNLPRTKVTKMIKAQGIDTSHFVSARGRPTLADNVLSIGTTRRNSVVKKFILDNDLLPEVCSGCGLGPEWQKKPMTLQLDHENGNAFDNRLENLRFLCPNCHSQTDTFTGRNARRQKDLG